MFGLMLKKTYDTDIKVVNKRCNYWLAETSRLRERLSSTVDGLSDRDIRILEAKKAGNYIYSVSCGEIKSHVLVPMSSKNWDSDAKKLAGYRRKQFPNCKAERWTI